MGGRAGRGAGGVPAEEVRDKMAMWPRRGPKASQKEPMAIREKQVPKMEAMAAHEADVLVRLMSWRMMEISGAAAKVLRKAAGTDHANIQQLGL